jgi:hypothetical protein
MIVTGRLLSRMTPDMPSVFVSPILPGEFQSSLKRPIVCLEVCNKVSQQD